MFFWIHTIQLIMVIIMFHHLYQFKESLGHHLNDDDNTQESNL